MAKAPIPGGVKTRLVPPLTCEQAAELYRAVLEDQLEQLAGVEFAERYLAYAPADCEAALRALGGAVFGYLPQRGADLGKRMESLCVDLLGFGHRNVIIMGSDLPGLPMEVVGEAFTKLSSAAEHVVLGPSRDGGYYLIGMNHPRREVFADMTWSHDRVLAQTIARLEQLDIPYSLLPAWFDLDRLEDLDHLAKKITPALRSRLRRTLVCLENLGCQVPSAGRSC